MGAKAGLDGRKISFPPGFGRGPSSPQSFSIPTELPGPHFNDDRERHIVELLILYSYFLKKEGEKPTLGRSNGRWRGPLSSSPSYVILCTKR